MSNTSFKTGWTEPIILAIDTSSSEASLAVSSDENVIASLIIKNNRPHSQTLFSQVSTLLHLAEISIDDVSAFAVATGPGSFTGLRVGLAAVKGLADSLNKPCIGVDSLDLLALASGYEGAHLAVVSAGRGEVYCGFREVAAGDIVNKLSDDMVGEPVSVMRMMMHYFKEPTLIIVGNSGLKYEEEVFNFLHELPMASSVAPGSQRIILVKQAANTSTTLAQRASCLMKKNHVSPIRPHYIRRSDAEIKWAERQSNGRSDNENEPINTSFRIAPMTPEVLSSVVTLEKECGLNSRGIDGYQKMMLNPNAIQLVVTDDAESQYIIGMFSGIVVLDELQLDNLAVSDPYRRKGIGQMLLKTALSLARRLGARTAILEVRSTNSLARAFYEGKGFRLVGLRKGYYASPPDDALLLSREIQSGS